MLVPPRNNTCMDCGEHWSQSPWPSNYLTLKAYTSHFSCGPHASHYFTKIKEAAYLLLGSVQMEKCHTLFSITIIDPWLIAGSLVMDDYIIFLVLLFLCEFLQFSSHNWEGMCNYHFVTDTNEIKEAGDLIHPISNGLSMWWKWTSRAVALDVERQKSGLMAPPNSSPKTISQIYLYIKLVPDLPGLTESKLSLSLIMCSNSRVCVLLT